MKETLRQIFAPILNMFENTEEQYVYKPSHRTILVVVGLLFSGLATGVIVVGFQGDGFGFLLPGLIFGSVGIVCLIVGGLGTNQGVAKIWNSRR